MSDVKDQLREAREAIKNKDYKTSIRLCKVLLMKNKSNYMGLILLGVSLQEVGLVDEALKAFKKAIQFQPDNALGWNGLINYYEKLKNASDEDKADLVKAYIRILQLETNEKKLVDYCQKLISLAEFGHFNQIIKAVFEVTKKEDFNSFDVYILLVKAISPTKEPVSHLLEILEICLQKLIENRDTVTVAYFSQYLSLLYKQQRTDQILQYADNMLAIYYNSSIPLVWTCRCFNKVYIECGDAPNMLEKVTIYSAELLSRDKFDPIALLTKSILLHKDNKLFECKETLEQVTKLQPNLSHAWFLLASVCAKLNLLDCGLNAISKVVDVNKCLHDMLLLLKLELFAKSGTNLEEAVKIYDKINDGLKEKCAPLIALAYINLNQLTRAEVVISELKRTDGFKYNLLSAKLLQKQNNLREALSLLESQTFDEFEWWFEVGLIYLKLGDYKKCLMPFLKAAKCNPDDYSTFLQLGFYYKKIDEFDKARRCFEKVMKMNRDCADAGVELSRMYIKLKKLDDNLNLLLNITAGVINKEKCWAWLQLGLTYLEQGNYVKAIENLQLVIRIEVDNIHCFEALADAYFSKGAYSSALKCYQRASELSENSLYSSLQVANIKKLLGEFDDARKDFAEILVKNGQYLPALQGLAETCMSQARKCLIEQRIGTARDHAQFAVEKLSSAVQQRGDISCIWKLFGDACYFVARLPEKYNCLLIPKAIVEGKGSAGNSILELDELFTFATRCYCKAIPLVDDNILLWHDLGSCYLHYALATEDQTKAIKLFDYAFATAQHCTSVCPTRWEHWNLFGLVGMLQGEPNYALAQHAFIKAVVLDHNNAVPWSNLGILYLLMNDIKLANKAFTQGQRADPGFVNSWIGQATIAEAVGSKEAMDLYRHSVQLQVHPEGALGYGHYVCQTLMDLPPNAVVYAIHNMHAVPVAYDALTWYLEKDPLNGTAWNMLGILQERLGLKLSAEKSFRNAYRLTDKSNRDYARINYGRLLTVRGNYEKSIEIFREIREDGFNSLSGLALALFKDEQFEESYNTYESVLKLFAQSEQKKSDLLVALASMAYMYQGAETAKTLLFQSIQLKSPSSWSFYATLSLGIIHSDVKLAKLVLKEMQHFKDDPDCLQHYALLLSYFYLLQGENQQAKTELSKLVHRHPNNPFVWLILSKLLIRLNDSTAAASRCAHLALFFGKLSKKMDVTKVLSCAALGSLLVGDCKQAKLVAQKAVHSYPIVAEGWAVLASVVGDKGRMLKHVEGLADVVVEELWLCVKCGNQLV